MQQEQLEKKVVEPERLLRGRLEALRREEVSDALLRVALELQTMLWSSGRN